MDIDITRQVLESSCSNQLLSAVTRHVSEALRADAEIGDAAWFPGTARIRWDVHSVAEVGAATIGDPRLTGRYVRDIIANDFESCVERADFALMITSYVEEPIVVGELGNLKLKAAPSDPAFDPESVTIEVKNFAHLHRVAASLQRIAIDRRLLRAFYIAEIAPPPTNEA